MKTNYYKNGKLDYYEVEDNNSGEVKKYNAQDQLQSTDKIIYLQNIE